MASFFFRARATALSALIGAFAAQTALAADMPDFVTGEPPSFLDRPVEFGTGWYLRGDIGYSNMQVPAIVADLVTHRLGSVSGGVGFGYQYNNWLRTDFTIDRTVMRPSGVNGSQVCPSGAIESDSTGKQIGYTLDPTDTCSIQYTTSFDRISPMINAYFDLGHWWGLTPYVGAGMGLSLIQSSGTAAVIQNWNGQLWAPNLGVAGVPAGFVDRYGNSVNWVTTIPFAWGVQNGIASSLAKRNWQFSWNLMAGVSYDVTQNIKVDLHYRFLDAGSYTGNAGLFSSLSPRTSDLISQEIRLGVRLTTD